MILRDVPKRDLVMGKFKRQDGEIFEIKAVLYECPPEIDYWLGVFDAVHTKWGHLRFQAIIPKRLAQTVGDASIYIAGAITEQVKASLLDATLAGRNFGIVFSMDGWTLI